MSDTITTAPESHTIKALLHESPNTQTAYTVSGWVRTRRDSKAGISFIALSDGSTPHQLQLVVPNSLSNYESDILRLTAGCSIQATGHLAESQGKNQAIELQITELTVIGWVDQPEQYPMSPKRHTMEHLREYSHLRPRTNIIGAVSRLRHHLAQAVHRFFDEEGYLWVNTPIITACDCEGAGELFTVTTLDLQNIPHNNEGHVDYTQDFFGQPAYLSVSGQLNVEPYCLALSKVYTFGPTFRSENSNTTRHLAEFWMIEPELAFADLSDIASLAERFVRYLGQYALSHCADDLAFFNQWIDKTCLERLETLATQPFTIMPYKEAIDVLKRSGHAFEYTPEWGTDLQTEHERYLTEVHCHNPVVVIDYPKDIKAFYMRDNDDGDTVAALDVLLPGVGEIIGGSLREDRYDLLKQKIIDQKLNLDDYQWYLDLRRYGSVPHGGFGAGFERLIRYISGVPNIREVSPYPRTPGSIPPNL